MRPQKLAEDGGQLLHSAGHWQSKPGFAAGDPTISRVRAGTGGERLLGQQRGSQIHRPLPALCLVLYLRLSFETLILSDIYRSFSLSHFLSLLSILLSQILPLSPSIPLSLRVVYLCQNEHRHKPRVVREGGEQRKFASADYRDREIDRARERESIT